MSLYLDGNTGYLDFGNIDSSEVDSGGPWFVSNYAQTFFMVYVESLQFEETSLTTTDILFETELSTDSYLPVAIFNTLTTKLDELYADKNC